MTTSRANYNQKIDQYMEYLRAFFKDNHLNMSIEHYSGHVLPGARLVNNDNHKSACITCDNNKNKSKALNRFYNIIFYGRYYRSGYYVKSFCEF